MLRLEVFSCLDGEALFALHSGLKGSGVVVQRQVAAFLHAIVVAEVYLCGGDGRATDIGGAGAGFLAGAETGNHGHGSKG